MEQQCCSAKQTAVTAYFSSKQLLLFAFCSRRLGTVVGGQAGDEKDDKQQ